MTGPFRLAPNMPVQGYVTYAVSANRDVGVVAACEQAGCAAWREGWKTSVDEATALGRSQALYIRTASRRTFTEQRSGPLTVFVFEAHQRCFQEHRTRSDVYVRRDGDWRGNPTGRVVRHVNAQDWVEDLQEHQASITTLIERG